MPLSVDDVLRRLGGVEAVAQLSGVSVDAIRKWRQARAIPTRHWPKLLAATGLSVSDLPASARLSAPPAAEPPAGATAVLALADGSLFWGRGFGAGSPPGQHFRPGEVCFTTGMTGYQETLTDPSFAGQIITFTFPHIGNVGANAEDIEAGTPAARGLVLCQEITPPSNWRARTSLEDWLSSRGISGISGIDTRALTIRIRDGGAPSGVLAYPADGRFDVPALTALAASWPGLAGMDLAREVSCAQSYEWDETRWAWPEGFARQQAPRWHVVAVDYGAKRNILRSLAAAGCRVTVVPATATAEEILGRRPDGIFLSNGPGDPEATGRYAIPAITGVLASGLPLFGICLGHQLLALTLGGRTFKMARGHRGANQPVKELETGKVEITSQNHGFAVDPASLPENVRVTHVSLFDGTNEGFRSLDRPFFTVQYHPEASPGPSDAHHLFRRFIAMLEAHHAAPH